MKIPWSIRMPALLVFLFLACLLKRYNDAASNGQQHFSVLTFNRSAPGQAQQIVAYWKADPFRTAAVLRLVQTDYILMAFSGLYLCASLYLTARRTRRRWLQAWLLAGILLVLAAIGLDAFQAYTVEGGVEGTLPVRDMRLFTNTKWIVLGLGILPLLVALVPPRFSLKRSPGELVRYGRQLLTAWWLFFPAILFLLLTIACFWLAGQGKDIVVSFLSNRGGTGPWHYEMKRTVFFLAIGFWVYVTWYSSRVIAYVKKRSQKSELQMANRRPGLLPIKDEEAERAFRSNDRFFEIGPGLLDGFPRLMGNACFLILELAVLQTPILYHPLTLTEAVLIFIVSLFVLRTLDRWMDAKCEAEMNTENENPVPGGRQPFARTLNYMFFKVLLPLMLVLLVAAGFSIGNNLGVLLCILVIFHVFFIFYTHLRRIDLAIKTAVYARRHLLGAPAPKNWIERVMDYFCIPRVESGYYNWFLGISGAGIILYFMLIVSLSFGRTVTPFPAIILAFGVLLAFGNLVTAFSLHLRINLHLLLLLLAVIVGNLWETHDVRLQQLKPAVNRYAARPLLKPYLSAWLDASHLEQDTSAREWDMYFVMANGGASRSGYWTASVLAQLEDASLKKPGSLHAGGRFSRHLFCLSGTSGGGVGVATFFAMLRDTTARQTSYTETAREFLKQDYFTKTFIRLLGPDFFKYIFAFIHEVNDRAAALEKAFETSAGDLGPGFHPVSFADPFSAFPACTPGGRVNMPLLCINTTRMQDGNPGVVTNLKLDSITFNNRVDVVRLLEDSTDISMASAAILGARFPYISPAGRIRNSYFVDGGYFDNSGAGVVQEMIRGIINIGADPATDPALAQRIHRLHFKVLHITNSPVIQDSTQIGSVPALKNDLLSPVLTILGAYDMQTTVNDLRLRHFIDDIRSQGVYKADYIQVPLYKERQEWEQDPLKTGGRFEVEPAYAMNWFMSDTTVRRIDRRLDTHPVVDSLKKKLME